MAGQQRGAIVPSNSPNHRMSYHVFLSFRGEDTRKTFTDHLYTALVNAGFRTFRDDDGIRRGENVTSELHNAIRQSRSSIIVFSKDYVSSRWCLDELCLILELRRAVKHVVLPVFYDVDPYEVRKQTGSFTKAFQRHEKNYNKAEVNKWRAALGEAAGLAGMVLKNQEDGHESKFVQKIIKVIGDKLHRTFSVLTPYLVGIDSIASSLNQWIRDESSSVQIAALCGMGGIGKTTVAKYVYNMNFRYFDGCSFLDEVRETSKRSDGLVHLQKKLLSDILNNRDEKIWSVDEGILKIQDALCSKRIFLVLDDVDHINQINAIFGMRNWFHPGSKIIITTRHGHLLRTGESYIAHDIGIPNFSFQTHAFCKIYNVKELNYDNSCRLFSFYAFGQDYPLEEYAAESMRIVNYCGGLPLALKVLGSSLRGKASVEVWRSTADKLQEIPNNQIMEKLKISFDSLQDDHDRNLFLHIVCFFIGREKDSAVAIFDECEFYTIVGVDNLIDRCVLSIDERNKLRMHQLLRDMGREIVRLESPKEPGKRSRLWHHKDSFRVLNEKSGTKTIEGLILDMHMFEKKDDSAVPEYNSDYSSASHENTSKDTEENTTEFEIDTFTEMKRLIILHLKHVKLTGSYENFPKRLRWLSWQGFPHNSITNILHLEDVVALDMRYSGLKQVSTQGKFIRSLKILDLRHSHGLTGTPDFSWVPNLERLVLKYCTNLVEIHESIGCLRKLVVLNLKECKTLEKLPENVTVLKSLEILDISGCISIKQLPNLSELDSLKVLLADRLAVTQLFSRSSSTDSSSQQAEISLAILEPRQSPEFSWAACLPSTLINLSLSNCKLSDGDFPWNLSRLCSLQKLDLSGNLFNTLPDFIRHLNLEDLSFDSCENLEFMEGLPRPVQLNIRSCTSLKKITYKKTEKTVVEAFQHFECRSLVDLEDEFKLEPLESANIELIEALGLNNLEIPKDMQVMIACSYWPGCSTFPIQGLYEKGTFSVFIPGEEVPSWFTHKCDGSTMFLYVPAIPGRLRVRGMNICGVYFLTCEQSSYHPMPLCLQVTNVRQRLTWFMYPSCCGIPMDENEYMMWLCHLNFQQPEQFEEGDEICVAFVAEGGFYVKECGGSFIHDSGGKHAQDYSSNGWFKLGVDFGKFTGHLEFDENGEDDEEDDDVDLDNMGTNENDIVGNEERPIKCADGCCRWGSLISLCLAYFFPSQEETEEEKRR